MKTLLVSLFFGLSSLTQLEATKDIVVIGDSITNGYPQTNYRSYCEFAQGIIDSNDNDYKIHKLAFNGATTADLDYFTKEALTHIKPNVAVICLGINDIASNVPYEVMKANYIKAIGSLRGNFVHVIVGGVDASNILPEKAPLLFRLYKELIEEFGVDAWVMMPDYIVEGFTLDKVHPNDVGQLLIAKSLYQKFISMGL
jgi:lysophospholipase L1-like esterase